MEKGFVLEDGPITSRLKHFDDVHLLKLPDNKPEDPKFFVETSAQSHGDENDEESDPELQRAIAESLGQSVGVREVDLTEENNEFEEDPELKRAIQASLNEDGSAWGD